MSAEDHSILEEQIDGRDSLKGLEFRLKKSKILERFPLIKNHGKNMKTTNNAYIKALIQESAPEEKAITFLEVFEKYLEKID